MRTTIALDPDVAAEVERLRRERPAGVSVIVNELIRRGMTAPRPSDPFVQDTSAMGARMDLRDVADVLETVDGPAAP